MSKLLLFEQWLNEGKEIVIVTGLDDESMVQKVLNDEGYDNGIRAKGELKVTLPNGFTKKDLKDLLNDLEISFDKIMD